MSIRTVLTSGDIDGGGTCGCDIVGKHARLVVADGPGLVQIIHDRHITVERHLLNRLLVEDEVGLQHQDVTIASQGLLIGSGRHQ